MLAKLVYTKTKVFFWGVQMNRKRNVNATGMTIHLTPSNFMVNRILVNGHYFDYRGVDLNIGDTVRIRQQLGNFLVVEKAFKYGKNYYEL